MSKVTERMLQVAAGITITYYAWSLAASTVVQMVNLSLANRELQRQVATCTEQVKGMAPHVTPAP